MNYNYNACLYKYCFPIYFGNVSVSQSDRRPTWQGDAVDDGGDEGLPAGPAQRLRSLRVRQEAVRKQLLVFQSAVQPADNTAL